MGLVMHASYGVLVANGYSGDRAVCGQMPFGSMGVVLTIDWLSEWPYEL